MAKWGSKKRRLIPDLRADAEVIMQRVRERIEVDPVTGCWNWKQFRNALGYGTWSWKGRTWQVHRLVLAVKIGPFDENLDTCHSCHNRGCCNPEHLRADEHRENLMDGSRAKRLQGQWKTHCKRGHPLSGDNLYVHDGLRRCLECHKMHREKPENRIKARERRRLYRAKKKAERLAQQQAKAA